MRKRDQILALSEAGLTAAEIIERTGLSIPYVYKVLHSEKLEQCDRLNCLINGWTGTCRGLIHVNAAGACAFYKDSQKMTKKQVADYERGIEQGFKTENDRWIQAGKEKER